MHTDDFHAVWCLRHLQASECRSRRKQLLCVPVWHSFLTEENRRSALFWTWSFTWICIHLCSTERAVLFFHIHFFTAVWTGAFSCIEEAWYCRRIFYFPVDPVCMDFTIIFSVFWHGVSPDSFLILLYSYQNWIFRLEFICILAMSLLLKNSIVIHAIQTKYSKFIIISQQKKVMNTRKMESSFI